MDEFELIRRYFTRPTHKAALGVGDDCALLQPQAGMQLAVSSDMLVCGQHFFADVSPSTLGHKALAVNLSDLAACGARPLAFTLALSLPEADEGWLEPFARGMFALADAYGCELVGGDTTRGPLNICITVFGEVPPGRALLRSGAQVGDDIWVSGTIGDARLALEALQGHAYLPPHLLQAARLRLEQPSPRLALGLALRGLATAAADVSDGLVGDLGHILGSSGVGAEIDLNAAIKLIAANVEDTGTEDQLGFKISKTRILNYILNGGDDYELVFTAPPTQRTAVRAAGVDTKTPVTRIGSIVAKAGLRLRDGKGKLSKYTSKSFNHFADSAKHTINHSYDSIFQEDI